MLQMLTTYLLSFYTLGGIQAYKDSHQRRHNHWVVVNCSLAPHTSHTLLQLLTYQWLSDPATISVFVCDCRS